MLSSAPTLAVLCLFAAGFLDLVFKFYSMQNRSRGVLICGVGCVWLALQAAYMLVTNASVNLNEPTLIYGSLAAVFVTVSNIALLEALGRLPISMASTIYRLNTIPLVILAVVFLGEYLSAVKIAGIAAGLFSVALLYQRDDTSVFKSDHYKIFLLVVIGASVIRALYGFVTKLGINNGGDINTMLLLGAIGWCVGGIAYAHLREKNISLTTDTLKYIFIAGILVFAVVWLLTMALKVGDASVVVPIANMGFVAAFTFSILLKMETLTPRKIGAIAMAMVAIVLLTRL